MGPGATLQVHGGHNVPPLLPIAELLLRGVIELKHKHSQESLSRTTVKAAVVEVRCMTSDI